MAGVPWSGCDVRGLLGAVGLSSGEDVPDRDDEGALDGDESAHRATASGQAAVAVLEEGSIGALPPWAVKFPWNAARSCSSLGS